VASPSTHFSVLPSTCKYVLLSLHQLLINHPSTIIPSALSIFPRCLSSFRPFGPMHLSILPAPLPICCSHSIYHFPYPPVLPLIHLLNPDPINYLSTPPPQPPHFLSLLNYSLHPPHSVPLLEKHLWEEPLNETFELRANLIFLFSGLKSGCYHPVLTL